MTIHNTPRSDLSETATKVHGWKRESFGVGYATDRFTRAENVLEVAWLIDGGANVTINDASATLDEAFALVRSEPSLQDTLRIIGEFHGWDRDATDQGDHYERDGDEIFVAFREDGTAIRARVNGDLNIDGMPEAFAALRAPRGMTPLQRLHQHIDGDFDNIPGEIINQVFLDSAHVMVGEFEDGYSLWWSDMVANDSTEFHPTLSSVLIRLAALARCGEHEWSIAFVDAGEFELAAQKFFTEGTA